MNQNKEEYYKLLVQCIWSDQLSARQITEHLKDKEFRDYFYKREGHGSCYHEPPPEDSPLSDSE